MRAKIASFGFILGILTIFKLHAMEEGLEKRTITVELSPSAAQKLDAYETVVQEKRFVDIPIKREINVILGHTTADEILKEIAINQNPSRIRGNQDGSLERFYRYQKLKNAYDKHLLSLWTIEEESDYPKERIPVDAPITETHGNVFYIRYNV